ncbi:DNA polymerase Y family protein [Rhodopseudomonas sp. BR0G17]|uniref:Y-family DNA polymerase n=1 Tax=Rhodopseudomonas sp. BR0G17 TaxID=2269368 RepID=UPI0013E0E732|nr:DNA polymerase Y family protein [Rhodopseudomonas sp. BR0G17]NEW98584.1 DNA polymerase Y family protein [Rhodopseudomonas sp. BR0G17]
MRAASVNRRRILGLWLPRLSTDRVERASPQASTGSPADAAPPPRVVAAKRDNALVVVACDARASRGGVMPGMPLATVRAMHPAVDVIDHDPHADAALLNAIADWCDRFTPLVALDGADGLLLDITGCAHLFGDELKLLNTLTAALTRQGFAVSAAIAGTAVAARALTRGGSGLIVAPGEELRAVAPLPVAALGVDDTIVRGLRRAGFKTVGEVLARQPTELAARFGEGFVAVLRQATGEDDAPISPRRPAPDYVIDKNFPEPVATTEVILPTLLALARLLIAAMERSGKGARQLTASFFRSDGAVRSISVETGQPVTRVEVVQRLFAEKLDALADPLDPGFGYDLIRLAASVSVSVAEAQRGFDTTAHQAEDVALLADTLAARLGARRVVRYLPQDTHIPERAALAVPVQHCPPDAGDAPWPERADEPPLRPLRLLQPPEPIDVMAGTPDDPPAKFTWRRVLHRVVRAEGPERIAMEWWRAAEPGLTRDYFRIEDEAGARFWVYRDGLYNVEVTPQPDGTGQPRWYMHGLFA